MAYTNIDDPSAYFQTVLYAGDSSNSTVITNDGNSDLQPDWVWIKSRNEGNAGTGGHMWFDSSRGIKSTTGSDSPFLVTNSTSGDQTNANGLQAIGTDSFTPGSMTRTNETGDNYVAWQWKANGGTTASNSDGSLASVVQANTTAGFSIVTWTGVGGARTVGHGLGVAPDVIIVKNRSTSTQWGVWHKDLADTDNNLRINSTSAEIDDALWNDTVPTSSVFSISSAAEVSNDSIAYCFAEKQGYSKFGSYIGNGSGTSDGTFDGPFVYTGFKPSWLMIKRFDGGAEDWNIFDNKRPRSDSTGNYINNKLYANQPSAESGSVYDAVDFLSNGFKIRTGRGGTNTSSGTYIYMAFAENPFTTSTGIPTTAR